MAEELLSSLSDLDALSFYGLSERLGEVQRLILRADHAQASKAPRAEDAALVEAREDLLGAQAKLRRAMGVILEKRSLTKREKPLAEEFLKEQLARLAAQDVGDAKAAKTKALERLQQLQADVQAATPVPDSAEVRKLETSLKQLETDWKELSALHDKWQAGRHNFKSNTDLQAFRRRYEDCRKSRETSQAALEKALLRARTGRPAPEPEEDMAAAGWSAVAKKAPPAPTHRPTTGHRQAPTQASRSRPGRWGSAVVSFAQRLRAEIASDVRAEAEAEAEVEAEADEDEDGFWEDTPRAPPHLPPPPPPPPPKASGAASTQAAAQLTGPPPPPPKTTGAVPTQVASQKVPPPAPAKAKAKTKVAGGSDPGPQGRPARPPPPPVPAQDEGVEEEEEAEGAPAQQQQAPVQSQSQAQYSASAKKRGKGGKATKRKGGQALDEGDLPPPKNAGGTTSLPSVPAWLSQVQEVLTQTALQGLLSQEAWQLLPEDAAEQRLSELTGQVNLTNPLGLALGLEWKEFAALEIDGGPQRTSRRGTPQWVLRLQRNLPWLLPHYITLLFALTLLHALSGFGALFWVTIPQTGLLLAPPDQPQLPAPRRLLLLQVAHMLLWLFFVRSLWQMHILVKLFLVGLVTAHAYVVAGPRES